MKTKWFILTVCLVVLATFNVQGDEPLPYDSPRRQRARREPSGTVVT